MDEEAGAESQRDAMLLTLEMEEGPHAKEGRRPLEGGTASSRFFPRVSRRNGSLASAQ